MSREWKDLPNSTLRWAEFLGHFSPTAMGRQVKGWMYDDERGGVHKVYLDSAELRELAAAVLDVGEFLESQKEPES